MTKLVRKSVLLIAASALAQGTVPVMAYPAPVALDGVGLPHPATPQLSFQSRGGPGKPPPGGQAGRPGGRGGDRPHKRPPARGKANVTINHNYHDDRRHDRHDRWDDWDDHWHPLETAATVAVTAAVVGSIVHSVPPSCSTVIVNGISYSQCGSTWYQPQYAGSSVQYVVVNPPR